VVGFPIRVTLGEVPSSVRLRIHKTFVDVNAGERCLLVVFEEMQIAPAPAADLVVADGARIELLQNDLQSTREHLQAVIEELETSNEELQSLNEELQAASEELQASNEELQTTNEELQATNEELTTVNDELSVKSQESQHLSETLTNIQNSVQTGIVVVDRQGRILRYNRLAVRFFGIMPEDLGTSLYGLPSYLPLPNLRANVERAIDGQASLERCERDGLHFVVQFAPYLAEAGGCSGTVISLLDVTELRRAEMELARSERRFRHLADALDEVVWMRTPTGSTLYVSPSYARLSGKDVANLESAEATFLDAVHPDDRARVAAAHQRATEASWVLEFRIARDDGSVRHVEERGRPVTDDAGLPAFLVSSLVDVTDRVHKEAALREGLAMASQLRSVAAAVPGGIFSALVDAALTTEISYASPRLGELVGLALDDLVGDPRSLVERLPAEERERLRGSLAHSVQTLAPWEETFRVQRPDGAERWLEVRAFAERAEDGRAVIHGFCHDVSARKASENSLARSEARYRGLFEQALSGIAELGLDGTLLQCNHRLAQLLGVPVGALLGQALQARAHPEDQSRLATLLAPHVRGAGADEAIEVRFQHHDGHYVWTAVVAGPILDAAGWPVGLTCVVSDIHALKAAQQQAAELDALLGSIVTTALDAVVSVDGEQRVAVFNPAAERLFGVGAAEVLGQNIRQLFPESDQATHPFLSHPLRVDGMHTAPTASGPIEVVGRHHNGTALPLEASFSYVDTGESMRCTAIVRDIRERRLAEQRIMTLNAELTRLNRSLDARAQSITSELSLRTEALERSNLELQQFAYVASHDLQTPLNAIAGFLELLQVTYSDALDDRGREWIGRAVEGAQRLKLLIRGLLDFARMDNVAQRFVDVDLEQLCDETFQTLRSSSDGRNAKLTRTALPQIMGDRLQIAQLLQNLLSNALKYRGERPPEVHVSARTEGDEVVVEVRDNGIGVSPLYHERIFEMFKRLHDERAYPGAGIGLALCRRIVHRHGGRIGLSSVPGEGSTFWFSVPRPTVAVLPEEVSEQQAEP
jgi:PAS domain S-box-containing protein